MQLLDCPPGTIARQTPSFHVSQFAAWFVCKGPPQSRETEEIPWFTCNLTTSVSDLAQCLFTISVIYRPQNTGYLVTSSLSEDYCITWFIWLMTEWFVVTQTTSFSDQLDTDLTHRLFRKTNCCLSCLWLFQHLTTILHHINLVWCSPCVAMSFELWPSSSRPIVPLLTGFFFLCKGREDVITWHFWYGYVFIVSWWLCTFHCMVNCMVGQLVPKSFS